VPRGETLELRLHPDVRLENWQSGAFRVLRTMTEAEGWQSLTMTGGGIEAETGPRRPSARVQAQAAEFWAKQSTIWQVDPEKSSVVAQIAYEVSQGRLFQLPVTLPPGGTLTAWR